MKRGVTTWNFHETNAAKYIYQQNDALFKYQYGNIIFALVSMFLFSVIIITFFLNETLFSKRGIHCRVFNVLCCPCPTHCLITNPDFEPDSQTSEIITDVLQAHEVPEEISTNENLTDLDTQSKTVIYCYKSRGEEKTWLMGKPKIDKQNIRLQVGKHEK